MRRSAIPAYQNHGSNCYHSPAMLCPHSREMDFTGRSMKGWVYVDEPGYESDEELAEWVQMGMDYARSLPAK